MLNAQIVDAKHPNGKAYRVLRVDFPIDETLPLSSTSKSRIVSGSVGFEECNCTIDVRGDDRTITVKAIAIVKP